ncbi:MAG: hypothetical protein ACI85I_002903, partial [Arenicella sp.]
KSQLSFIKQWIFSNLVAMRLFEIYEGISFD